MRLLVLEDSKWVVTAVQELKPSGDFSCPWLDSIASLGPNYEKSLDGLVVMLEKFSEHGQKMLNKDICHEVDENEKIFEFIKGDLRLLWFYGKGNKLIICSHCFVKKGQKTPKNEKDIAIRVKARYMENIKKSVDVPLYYEEDEED
ncbi:type II toxin-antitoxin system RelE/ParE family toxin [Pseudomonas viridiflava]|uniref:type II toxin-antitoxin system RelE/ParE family toxin n=1 Tax=Pseudomonas viridiflava TaxID=33069 RepID=UPI0013CEFCD5|nr:type II toxin-antitoxin system RelE/ParE family toxin [Pseudomonas viridiflava]